jgi:hypothetical protein
VITTHPDLKISLGLIKRALIDCEIPHVIDPTEQTNTYTCGTATNGYFNFGMIGYDEKGATVFYCAIDAAKARRNQMEGVPESESRSWWVTYDMDTFLRFLMGDIREVQHKAFKQGAA